MNFEFEKRLSPDSGMTVQPDNSVINELQDSMVSIATLTKKRVHIPLFPYSAINHNPDDNYRKSGVDPQDESLIELGRGIENSGLQQPIGLIATELNADELLTIVNNGLAEDVNTWATHIGVIFGNRRYLSVTHHTSLTHEAAYIYPKECLPYVETISLIENMDRENVNLSEESARIFTVVNERFNHNINAFARFSGKPKTALGRLYKIGEAASQDTTFAELLKSDRITDQIALDNLARAITLDTSPARKVKLDQFFKNLSTFEGKIKSIRTTAQKLRDYAEGSTNKTPNIEEQKPNKSTVENTQIDNNLSAKKEVTNDSEDIKFNEKGFVKRAETLITNINTVDVNTLDIRTKETLINLKSALEKKGF